MLRFFPSIQKASYENIVSRELPIEKVLHLVLDKTYGAARLRDVVNFRIFVADF